MRYIAKIEDLHITEMVKVRKHFKNSQNELLDQFGGKESDRSYINECSSSIKILDELILNEFKALTGELSYTPTNKNQDSISQEG